MSDSVKAQRARAEKRRATMVGRLVDLREKQPPIGRTVRERLQMLAEISARSWALSGRPIPQYSRQEMPGVIIRKLKS